MTTRMKMTRILAAALVCGVVSLPLGGVASASWVTDNCNGSNWPLDGLSRALAYAYVQEAAGEGYEWGGGCFRLNDVDDTPQLPTDGGGEGTDCSGLVFKTWALRMDGAPGFRYWEHEKDTHGPWSTGGYYAPSSSDPFKTISKTYKSTEYMDALVHRDSGGGHIALINAEGTNGSDWVIHSYTNTDGTLIQYRDFRSQSIYRAVMRKSWSPDCYPKCPTV